MSFGPLHYRSPERDKSFVLKFANGNFDKKMEVSQAGEMDMLYWINSIEDSLSSIQFPNCSFLLKRDASKSGWSVFFDKETAGGHFSLDESLLHINILELKAVLFGLKNLWSHLRLTHIKVLSDKANALCIRN